MTGYLIGDDSTMHKVRGKKMAAAKDLAQMVTATSLRDSTLKKLAENGQ